VTPLTRNVSGGAVVYRMGLQEVRPAVICWSVVVVGAGRNSAEVIVPEARRMPLYHLIHDPFGAFQERGHVKAPPTMPDVLQAQEAAA
jgi:hypothetical protein